MSTLKSKNRSKSKVIKPKPKPKPKPKAKVKLKPKKAVGRPKFVIDYAQVEKLAMLQCTHEEIAAFVGCSHDTLARDDRFCVVHKKGMDKGKMSLRRKQWKALEAGNTTMLIWLGKQYLGQRDKHEHTGKNNGPIETKVTFVGVSAKN